MPRKKKTNDMFKVYVAGPYTAKSDIKFIQWLFQFKFFKWIGVHINIMRARKVSKLCWKTGWATFCPHSNSAHFDNGRVATEETFMKGGLAFLKTCNAIVLMKRWEKSSGTKIEKEYAEKQGLKIIMEEDLYHNYISAKRN